MSLIYFMPDLFLINLQLIFFRPCNCHVSGTVDSSVGCDDSGKCECESGAGGDKCDTCLPSYYNITAGCEGMH